MMLPRDPRLDVVSFLIALATMVTLTAVLVSLIVGDLPR
jgi:hypothetical protein